MHIRRDDHRDLVAVYLASTDDVRFGSEQIDQFAFALKKGIDRSSDHSHIRVPRLPTGRQERWPPWMDSETDERLRCHVDEREERVTPLDDRGESIKLKQIV